MHFNVVADGVAKVARHLDNSNVDMNASTAAVYESKSSGIVNALHALLDKAKSRSDVGTKADIYIQSLRAFRRAGSFLQVEVR